MAPTKPQHGKGKSGLANKSSKNASTRSGARKSARSTPKPTPTQHDSDPENSSEQPEPAPESDDKSESMKKKKENLRQKKHQAAVEQAIAATSLSTTWSSTPERPDEKSDKSGQSSKNTKASEPNACAALGKAAAEGLKASIHAKAEASKDATKKPQPSHSTIPSNDAEAASPATSRQTTPAKPKSKEPTHDFPARSDMYKSLDASLSSDESEAEAKADAGPSIVSTDSTSKEDDASKTTKKVPSAAKPIVEKFTDKAGKAEKVKKKPQTPRVGEVDTSSSKSASTVSVGESVNAESSTDTSTQSSVEVIDVDQVNEKEQTKNDPKPDDPKPTGTAKAQAAPAIPDSAPEIGEKASGHTVWYADQVIISKWGEMDMIVQQLAWCITKGDARCWPEYMVWRLETLLPDQPVDAKTCIQAYLWHVVFTGIFHLTASGWQSEPRRALYEAKISIFTSENVGMRKLEDLVSWLSYGCGLLDQSSSSTAAALRVVQEMVEIEMHGLQNYLLADKSQVDMVQCAKLLHELFTVATEVQNIFLTSRAFYDVGMHKPPASHRSTHGTVTPWVKKRGSDEGKNYWEETILIQARIIDFSEGNGNTTFEGQGQQEPQPPRPPVEEDEL